MAPVVKRAKFRQSCRRYTPSNHVKKTIIMKSVYQMPAIEQIAVPSEVGFYYSQQKPSNWEDM